MAVDITNLYKFIIYLRFLIVWGVEFAIFLIILYIRGNKTEIEFSV